MTPVLAFDIETIPDVEGLRRLYDHGPQTSPAEVAQAAFDRRREATGSDFLPLHLHRVVAIACALRDRDSFRVWSLGEAGQPQHDLVERVFDGIGKYNPHVGFSYSRCLCLPVLK